MSERDELFTRALESLQQGGELAPKDYDVLAHQTREELARFRLVWHGLTPSERIALLNRLHQWEQSNQRLDFNGIYRIALDAPEPEVRATAAAAIVEDFAPDLLDKLGQLALDDPDSRVRLAAAQALGPFALRAELRELPPHEARQVERTLIAVVDRVDEAPAVRGAALASLGYLDTVPNAERIKAAYEDDALRLDAVRAMGRSANPTWLDVLKREAASDDAAMRAEVARACGEMADERAAEFVADMIDDPVVDVRLAAIAALGHIGGEESREALIYALQDPREFVQAAAEAALSELEANEDPLGI